MVGGGIQEIENLWISHQFTTKDLQSAIARLKIFLSLLVFIVSRYGIIFLSSNWTDA